jgi:hypothetical protein
MAIVVGCSQSPSSVAPAPTRGSATLCEADIPFDVSFLPDGFDDHRWAGRAPDGAPLDEAGQYVVHYRGDNGAAIEIRRPGTLFAELAQFDDVPTIKVLGKDTAGFAPVNPGGDRFIVQFTYGDGVDDADDPCAMYSINEYGVPLETLKRVAVGLRPS